ncbi:MAG: hypothetical protein AAGF24_08145 [Cyanobacteria bacterium P01_H01_bin.121]
MNTYTLSPTTITWETGCPACLKAIANGWKKPRLPFPGLFSQLDRAQRQQWNGQSTMQLDMLLPPAMLNTRPKSVESVPFQATKQTAIIIKGRPDCRLEFSQPGVTGLLDFKSTKIDKNHSHYSPQLHSYAFADEHPAKGDRRSVNVLGLVVYEPQELVTHTEMTWDFKFIPIPYEPAKFKQLLRAIARHLEMEHPPSRPGCMFCAARAAGINANSGDDSWHNPITSEAHL